ncbi:hypothetical protein [Colwellia echini]|uniref:hypothetical protein n=1 Tax=Colwellia echini TaxID=1982103 RepID=UPI001FE6C1B2|nr:hypothetical protein [Colwellia echini]
MGTKPLNGVHHMHFWSLDGESHVLTAHVELTNNIGGDELIRLKERLNEELFPYHLSHTTIEFEFPKETCRDERVHD